MPTAEDVINRLCKWRMVFAGWQLGTRLKGDPESDAVRDHREVTILMRAELSALTAMMIKKKVFTAEEYTDQVIDESEWLEKAYQRRFPGIRASDDGMEFFDLPAATRTMKGWKP